VKRNCSAKTILHATRHAGAFTRLLQVGNTRMRKGKIKLLP